MKKDNEIAGKTGTTSNHSDGWCIGMTQGLCVGVWVGGENRCIHFRTLDTGQGAVTARPIWEKFMLHLYADPAVPYKKGPLPKPTTPLNLPCMKETEANIQQKNQVSTPVELPEMVENEQDTTLIEDEKEDTLDTYLNADEVF